MGNVRGRLLLLMPALVVLGSAGSGAAGRGSAGPGPWQRTESREVCVDFDTLRRPYFGETHVHTTLSFDAVSGDVRAGPAEAYAFAKGAPIGLPPFDAAGEPLRSARLRRPLDFAAITDHAEFFGEVDLCLMPGSPVFDDPRCAFYRNDIPQVGQTLSNGLAGWAFLYTAVTHPLRLLFCGPDGALCRGRASVVWQEIRDAAEEHYDRSSACTFTSFVGYEWTGTPSTNNLHRNVLFRNDVVPALPTSYVDQPTAQGLWAALRSQCSEALPGCDFLSIPHNPNVSGGMMFDPVNADGSPLTAADAAFRLRAEPLVEITQHKGDSECRTGVLTNDELCGYEKWPSGTLGTVNPVFSPLNFVRNVLKEGLVQEENIGANPFQLGVIGATDTHNATPGLTNEDDYVATGHLGTRDGTPQFQAIPFGQVIVGGMAANPGGLGAVWAEENSRDALFSAMRRREVYATSGTRPVVRAFAGDLPRNLCHRADFVRRGYLHGVPMGGELGAVRGRRSPRFAVLALRDPGGPGFEGSPLQRVQMVKGWLDPTGDTQEQVFEIAGDPDNGADVDVASCTARGVGFDTLCSVWEDPDFDPEQRAFYYARVLENPVCRWSTRLCNAEGVECAEPGSVPPGFEQCCNPGIPKTIQERAWTSPHFYRPEAVGRLAGSVHFDRRPGRDVLRLSATIHRLPEGVDPATDEVEIELRDDDRIFAVTLPPGALEPSGADGSLAYRDRARWAGGLRRLRLRRTQREAWRLSLATAPMDLSAANRSSHFVEVLLRIGEYRTRHVRLWGFDGKRLRTENPS